MSKAKRTSFEEQNAEVLEAYRNYVSSYVAGVQTIEEAQQVLPFSEWRERFYDSPTPADDPITKALASAPADLRGQERFIRDTLPRAFLESRWAKDEKNRRLGGEESQTLEGFVAGVVQEAADNPEVLEELKRDFEAALPGFAEATASVDRTIAEREEQASRAATRELRAVAGKMQFADSTVQGAVEEAIKESAYDDDPAQKAATRVVRALAATDLDALMDVVDDLPSELQEAAFTVERKPTAREVELESKSLEELDAEMEAAAPALWKERAGHHNPGRAAPPDKPRNEMSLDELDIVMEQQARAEEE